MKCIKFLLILFLFSSSAFDLIGQVITPAYENGTVRIINNKNRDYELRELNQKIIKVESSSVDLRQHLNKLYNDDVNYPDLPIYLGSKTYDFLLIRYKEIKIEDGIYGFFFPVVVKKVDDFYQATPDFNMNYNFNDEDQYVELQSGEKFMFDFKVNNKNYQLEFQMPDLEVKRNEPETTFSENLIRFEIDFEFGLGGSGKESYAFVHNSESFNNSIAYEYEYRSGHFGLGGFVNIKNIILGAVAVYEIRQPRNGIMVISSDNYELIDNGIAKLFPKGRTFLTYNIGYEIDLSQQINLVLYGGYGNFSYSGYASDNFNELKNKRYLWMGGTKLNIAHTSHSNFYINVSINKDNYSMDNQNIKAYDGQSYIHYPTDLKHFQINFAFGYGVNL